MSNAKHNAALITEAESLEMLSQRREQLQDEAARRMSAIADVMTPQWQANMAARVNTLISEPSSIKSKVRKIYTLMDVVGTVRAPYVACESGCSSCCHMQVEMTDTEAKGIAAATGHVAAPLPPGRHTTSQALLGRPTTPCPFLVDHQCSIYEHRPFVCRDMAVLDRDALTCGFVNMRLEREGDPRVVPVPQASTHLKHVFFQISSRASTVWADIRQFFPDVRSFQAGPAAGE